MLKLQNNEMWYKKPHDEIFNALRYNDGLHFLVIAVKHTKSKILDFFQNMLTICYFWKQRIH